MHNQIPTRVTPAVAQPTNARQIWRVMWRRRGIIALVALLVAGVVGVGLLTAHRQYAAIAKVAATPPVGATQSPANYTDMLGTLASVASSRPLLAQVSQEVGTRTVTQLQDSVTGSVVTGSLLIQVRVTDADPAVAARVANFVVAALQMHDPSRGWFVMTATEPAVVPTTFTSPNIKVTALAGLVLALALGAGAALGYDKFARTVETSEDVTASGGSGVLGLLPRPSDAAGLPALDSTTPEFASLRALRIALEYASSENPTRCLVVAPVVADPWSGWLEVNLAVALADVGHRVLLIDANRSNRSGQRHPALESAGAFGVYEVLAGDVDLAQATVPGPVERVTVLPLGNPDIAAPTLLEMRFRRMIADIDPGYDVILVHSGPVTDSDDARIMAIDNGMLLTVPSGRVKPATLHGAVAGLNAVRTNVVGTVLFGKRSGRRR